MLIALDQFIWNWATLGNVDPDMTLSASAWRSEKNGKLWGKIARPIIDFLFLPFEQDHCYASYVSEIYKRHLPEDMR